MILYFADRHMDILGMGSTSLRKGFWIDHDMKTEDIDTGVASFECDVHFSDEDRLKIEELVRAGNYILRHHEDEDEFYTIITCELNVSDKEVYLYAEDAGLDLLNEIVPAFSASGAQTIAWYVNKYAYDSGFEIGINELGSNHTRSLSWDSESTVAERIRSVATQFDAEIGYSFAIDKLRVTHKYINIYTRRGQDAGVQLRLGRDLANIVRSESIENLVTGLEVTGGVDQAGNEITLKGYSYDDGDIYVASSTGRIYSRLALEKWSRYVWAEEPNRLKAGGHIVGSYMSEAVTQAALCREAVAYLRKHEDPEVNYDVTITDLPGRIRIGDTVNIVDDAGELYLSARVLQLQTSISEGETKAVLGDYLIKSSGISEQLEELAKKFAGLSSSRSTITSDVEPTDTTLLWCDTSADPPQLKRYDESLDPAAWVIVGDPTDQISDAQAAVLAASRTLAEDIAADAVAQYSDTVDAQLLTINNNLDETNETLQASIETLTQAINDVQAESSDAIAGIKRYIRINEQDGSILFGEETANPLTLKIRNDRIQFLQNGTEVAYITDRKMYNTICEITNSLIIGDSAWIIETNSSGDKVVSLVGI